MPDIRFSTEIHNRYQFGSLCHFKGLTGTAMELGVNQGEFAGHFLAGWGGEKYYAVDHYLPYCDMQGDRETDKRVAHARLLRFADRVVWSETDSFLALKDHADASLDFIYADADHHYWAVMQEIEEGWKKIKPGGIFAGHDFYHGTPDVMRAVREFSDRETITVWITQDDWSPFSWYAEKPR